MTSPAELLRADRHARQALARHDLATVLNTLLGHGLTQRDIAAMMPGMRQSDIWAIASGRRQVATYRLLERVCGGLVLPRGWLGLEYDPETVALLAAAVGRTS